MFWHIAKGREDYYWSSSDILGHVRTTEPKSNAKVLYTSLYIYIYITSPLYLQHKTKHHVLHVNWHPSFLHAAQNQAPHAWLVYGLFWMSRLGRRLDPRSGGKRRAATAPPSRTWKKTRKHMNNTTNKTMDPDGSINDRMSSQMILSRNKHISIWF